MDPAFSSKLPDNLPFFPSWSCNLPHPSILACSSPDGISTPSSLDPSPKNTSVTVHPISPTLPFLPLGATPSPSCHLCSLPLALPCPTCSLPLCSSICAFRHLLGSTCLGTISDSTLDSNANILLNKAREALAVFPDNK